MESEVNLILSNTEQSIRSLESSLKALLIQNCSKQCTTFCLAFSTQPLPNAEASKRLCENLESSVFTIASLFSLVPQSEGKRFYKYLQSGVLAIVESAADLVKVTLEGPDNAKKQLQNTGTLWEACDKALKLPKDNRETIILQLDECSTMVKDAYKELEECQRFEQCSREQEDGDSCYSNEVEHQLNDNEKLMITPSLNLIKVAMATLTKIRHSIKSIVDLQPADQLDVLSDAIDHLSPAVDNLATCFFIGSSTDTVDQQAVELCKTVKDILSELRKTSCCTPADHERVEFLEMAADHNLTKLQDVTKVLLNVIAC